MHEIVAVPWPVRLFGVIGPQLRFDGTVLVNVMVPTNPLSADTVMVEEAFVPAFAGVGVVAVTVKSWNLNIAVALCDRAPLVPVMVTV